MPKASIKEEAGDTKIQLGWHLDQDNLPVEVMPGLVDHHTAVLAQSGAGKSFFLGRFVEELLLCTKSRVVVFDVNGDFRRFHEVDGLAWSRGSTKKLLEGSQVKRDHQAKLFAKDWMKVKCRHITQRIVPPKKNMDTKPGKIDWSSLGFQEKLAALEIQDGLEIMCLRNTESDLKENKTPNPTFRQFLDASINLLGEPIKRLVGQETLSRFIAKVIERNNWTIWSDKTGTADIGVFLGQPEELRDVTILDLPSIKTIEERLLAVNVCLDKLWLNAEAEWEKAFSERPEDDKRAPIFIIVDEAQNLVPADSSSNKVASIASKLMRIAAEGRKYGLFLVVATQRPTKVLPGLLSECENVCLLRLQSTLDLKLVSSAWGVPDEVISRVRFCTTPGDGLIFGRWLPSITAFHVAPRRTKEGGRNLQRKKWAVRRF